MSLATKITPIVVVLAVIATGAHVLAGPKKPVTHQNIALAKTPTKTVNACSANTQSQLILVSISKQHLWVCTGSSQTYDTAVTTGAYKIEGDATPTGTWQIYAKQTSRYLDGSDAHGSWHDYVNYWMPFDGDVGFHDAIWQTFSFGDLTKYGSDGSHGCVHLPLTAAKWLYNWAKVGTTVTIQS